MTLMFTCQRETRADTYRLTMDLLETLADEEGEAAAAALVSAFIVIARDHDESAHALFTRIYDLISRELFIPDESDKDEIDQAV